METGELLKNLRLIVREEMTPFIERMDAKFDHTNNLFDGVFAELNRHASELASITAGLTRVEKRLDSVEMRLGSVEKRLSVVESELQLAKSMLTRLEERIAALEKYAHNLDAHLADLERKVVTESEIVELRVKVLLLNGRVAELEARR